MTGLFQLIPEFLLFHESVLYVYYNCLVCSIIVFMEGTAEM